MDGVTVCDVSVVCDPPDNTEDDANISLNTEVARTVGSATWAERTASLPNANA